MCFTTQKTTLKVGMMCAEQQIYTKFGRYRVFSPDLIEPQSRYGVCQQIKEMV